MIKVVAGLWGTVPCGLMFVPLSASAANDIDKAALKKATAECRAQVKEYANTTRLRGTPATRWSRNASRTQNTSVGSANSRLAPLS